MNTIEMITDVLGALTGKFIKSFVYTAGIIAAIKLLA